MIGVDLDGDLRDLRDYAFREVVFGLVVGVLCPAGRPVTASHTPTNQPPTPVPLFDALRYDCEIRT
jgi:hypothetical protein